MSGDEKFLIDTIARLAARPSVCVVWNQKKISIDPLLNCALSKATEEERILLLDKYIDVLEDIAGIKKQCFSLTITKRVYPKATAFVCNHVSVILWIGIARLSFLKECDLEKIFLENGLIHINGDKELVQKYTDLLVGKFNFVEFTNGEMEGFSNRMFVP